MYANGLLKVCNLPVCRTLHTARRDASPPRARRSHSPIGRWASRPAVTRANGLLEPHRLLNAGSADVSPSRDTRKTDCSKFVIAPFIERSTRRGEMPHRRERDARTPPISRWASRPAVMCANGLLKVCNRPVYRTLHTARRDASPPRARRSHSSRLYSATS